MVPEMAAAYVIGLPATAGLTGLHAFLFRRKMNSAKMRNIQMNLQSVNLFWSDAEGKIKPWSEGAVEADRKTYFTTVKWLGILCFFLSWIGFFLQLLVMVSIRYLARPRTERKIYDSDLTTARLPK